MHKPMGTSYLGITAIAVTALFPVLATAAKADDALSAYDYFRTIPPDIATGRATAPAPGNTTPVPITVNKTNNGVSVRTGLSTLREYNAKTIKQKIDGAKGKAPANLKLPKTPTAIKTPLDVWTKFDAESNANNATNTLRTTLGADYKLLDNATAGISAQQSETEGPLGGAPIPTDRNYSAYMNLKASSLLSVDAKTQWQRREGDAFSGISAREKNSFSLAPKIEKEFDLGDGLAVTPYATIKHQLDINVLDGSEQISNSAGGGVTLSKPDTYSVTVSTDVQESSTSADPTVKSRVQLKVPLP